MTVKDFKVEVATLQEVRPFIEKWHYSKSVNGVMHSHCFKLMRGDEMIGAMIYGRLAMAGVSNKYGCTHGELLELRRLCCIDDTPRNTESYFIGATLRWLKKNANWKMVISYADTMYGHEGTIYKASNFTYNGMTAPSRVIDHNGKIYHDKAIRTKYKGRLKPFAQRLKDALDSGEAHYVHAKGKHIYTYPL